MRNCCLQSLRGEHLLAQKSHWDVDFGLQFQSQGWWGLGSGSDGECKESRDLPSGDVQQYPEAQAQKGTTMEPLGSCYPRGKGSEKPVKALSPN